MTEGNQVYLTRKQVLNRLGISGTTFWRWSNDSEINFPKAYTMGPRCVRWKVSELEAWEQARQGVAVVAA